MFRIAIAAWCTAAIIASSWPVLTRAEDLRLKTAPSLRVSAAPAVLTNVPVTSEPIVLRLARALAAPQEADGFRPAPTGLQELIVSLEVNGLRGADTRAFMTPDARFLLPASALQRWVRIPPQWPRARIGGETFLFVNDVPGAHVKFDEPAVELRLVLPPSDFPRQVFRYRSDAHAPVTVSRDLSALLTYSVAGSEVRRLGSGWSLSAESDFAYGGWLLRNQYLHLDSDDRGTSLRGLTQLVKDDPSRLTRFIAGDFFLTPTELTGGAILGGLSYSRSFELDPYFVRQPTAAYSGSAELPSDVTFYVGNLQVYRQRVAPGPFEIGNVSYITGQRDVRIVVRDIAGNQRTILFPFYFADQALAPGLHDFSYQVGAIRQNATTENADFRDAAFSATHRVGVNDWLTAGLHGEGTRDFVNAGPSLVLRSDRLGVISLAWLASHDRTHAANGHAGALQYTFQSGRFAGTAGLHRASADFAFLRPEFASGLPLRDDFVALSYGEERYGTVSVSDRYVRNVGEQPTRDTAVTYSVSLGPRSQWNVHSSYHRMAGPGAGSEVDVGVQYVPRPDLVGTASYHSSGGVRTSSLEVGNVISEGEGHGYHLTMERSTAAGGSFNTVSPSLDERTRVGELQVNGSWNSSPNGQTSSMNAAWSGSFAYVARRFGLSRPTADSFALVQIEPPLANVRVRLNSQTSGKTDAAGRLFLPRVVSYVENRITLEDKDIPISYGIAERSQVIVPQPHTGYTAVFHVRKVMAVSGRLRYRRAGRALPLDSVLFKVTVEGERLELPTGTNGEFYFENVPPGRYPAEVEIDERPCRFTVTVPSSDEPVVDLHDVQTCDLP